MNGLRIVVFIIALVLFGFRIARLFNNNDNNRNESMKHTIQQMRYQQDRIQERLKPDEYSVGIANLQDYADTVKVGKLWSQNRTWFMTADKKESLAFDFDEAGNKTATYHFLNKEVPAELISEMPFYTSAGEPNATQKRTSFKSFLEKANKLDLVGINTSKGLHMGSLDQQAVSIYGQPDSTVMLGEIKRFYWNQSSVNVVDGDLTARPAYSVSHNQVNMFFKKNKLIAMVMRKDH